MKIYNVVEICDNGEFTTIVTDNGNSIQLPKGTRHSIIIQPVMDPSQTITVSIDLHLG